MRIPFLSLCFALFVCTTTLAQGNKQLKIGLGLAGFTYVGDLVETDVNLKRVNPGMNISLQTAGTSHLQMQVNVGFSKLTEQADGGSPPVTPVDPGYTFVETSLFYGDMRLKYRPLTESWFQPFVSVGAGLLVFSPKDANGNSLTAAQVNPYNGTIPQIPLTGGIEFKLTNRFATSIEFTHRLTPTDFLDDRQANGAREGNDYIQSLHLNFFVVLAGKE